MQKVGVIILDCETTHTFMFWIVEQKAIYLQIMK